MVEQSFQFEEGGERGEMNYWKEALIAAFEDAGIDTPSDDKLELMAGTLEGAHENYGMSPGYHCISDPRDAENRQLKKELENERRKVMCRECRGRGEITEYGPSHSSSMQCWKCRGEGKVAP